MDAGLQAYSIPEFCEVHSISRAHFYNLLKSGLGPKTMVLGKRRLISIEAAREWRQRMSAGARPARKPATRKPIAQSKPATTRRSRG